MRFVEPWSMKAGSCARPRRRTEALPMPDFVYDASLRTLALYAAVLAVGITWFGILVVKPILRLLVGRDANVNTNISYATSIFGLFYGLLMGLLAVAAYQNADRVEQAAFQEATAVANLYGQMNNYPDPYRSELKDMLRDYALFTIHKDWPAHRGGDFLNGGTNRTAAMRQSLAAFEPQTPGQEILHRQATQDFQGFVQARQERLAGVITRIPSVLWYAVIVGAVINVVLLVMLRMGLFTHLILGGLASFFLGVIIFVIVALDDPLRGARQIQPAAMELVWERVMMWDEPIR